MVDSGHVDYTGWFPLLEAAATQLLTELGIQRDPQLHALVQVELLVLNRVIDAEEWRVRGSAAVGREWGRTLGPPAWSRIAPIILEAPKLPPSPKLFELNRPPVPGAEEQLANARAQLEAWRASGARLAAGEQLVWWVHPRDLTVLKAAVDNLRVDRGAPSLLGLPVFVVSARETDGRGPVLKVDRY